MGDALVAIDAGLALSLRLRMVLLSARTLLAAVHCFERVAIAALARVRLLHHLPHTRGECHAVRFKLGFGVDGAHQLMIELVARLDLTRHLVYPVLRHMTIRADCPYAGAIGIVHRAQILLIDIVVHLVAADAKRFGIGRFKARIEASPEDDSGDEADDEQRQDRVFGAWTPQCVPEPAQRSRGLTTHGKNSLV